jgi:hypothetical protein
VLSRIIGVGDVLGGRTIASLDLGRSALDGPNLGFLAGFSDSRALTRGPARAALALDAAPPKVV